MNPSILIIGPAHPLRGGLSSFNERLARAFASEKKEVQIFTFSLQYPNFLFPGTTQYSNEPAPTDIRIQEKINAVNPLNWLLVGRMIKKIKPDIIVVRYWLPFMGPCLGTILRIVKKNKHTKIICIADNIIPHEKRFGDTAFTKFFMKPIDGFITMSEKVRNDIHTLTTKKVVQVTHPLYDNFGEKINSKDAKEKLGIQTKAPIVLFFGFIRKYKGLDVLFEAIHILQAKNYFVAHPVQFLIAGEFYENEQPYVDLIEKLQIQDHLILHTHFINDSEVKYYLSAADCVIQPYKSATQSGVTPLAYHFEKPMIVTNVGGLPDLVPEHVGIIAEPNADSIAEKIEFFFTQKHNHYLLAIQEEKKKYSWQNLTRAIVSLAHSI